MKVIANNPLKNEIDAKYPMPANGDVLEELKQMRIRTAFESGVYWAMRQFIDFIPLEDKDAPIGYNTACEDIIENRERFYNSITQKENV